MENDKIYTIYKILNEINGKIYIGFTKSFERRMKQHAASKIGKFHNAVIKYGWESFTKEIIYQSKDKDHCLQMEIYFIKEYNSIENGYNILEGGQSRENIPNKKPRKPLTEKQRKRISEGVNKAYDNNPLLGEKLSKAQKEGIRSEENYVDPRTGTKLTEEHIQKTKIGQKLWFANNPHPMQGKKLTEEERKKLSDAHKNSPRAMEVAYKLGQYNKGKSSWNKGIPPSEEAKQKRLQTIKEKYPDGCPGKPKKRITLICVNCEISFEVKPCHLDRKCCSKGCATSYRYK